VFESYLDDFERKKSEKQESPLHRPVSKSSIPIPKTSGVAPAPIPAVKNLWSKPDTKPLAAGTDQIKLPGVIGLQGSAEAPKGVVDLQLGSSPSKSSESDFADFQQAPVIGQDNSGPTKTSKSDLSLIGEEDKYAALRSLDFGSETTSEVPVAMAEAKEEEDENWADFQGVEEETEPSTDVTSTFENSTGVDNKNNTLSLFSSSTVIKSEPEWADFRNGSAAVSDSTPAFIQPVSDWSAFNSSAQTVSEESEWSNFSSATQPTSSVDTKGNILGTDKTETSSDGWAEFQGPAGEDKSQKPNTIDTHGLVSIKKDNLQKGEILGLFKVRETSDLPADLKVFNTPRIDDIPSMAGPVSDLSANNSPQPALKVTKISVSSLDEDP